MHLGHFFGYKQTRYGPHPFDFIFIDGNHDYDYVVFDLALSAKTLSPNGLVAAAGIGTDETAPPPERAGEHFCCTA